jgi:hypothetical protein
MAGLVERPFFTNPFLDRCQGAFQLRHMRNTHTQSFTAGIYQPVIATAADCSVGLFITTFKS